MTAKVESADTVRAFQTEELQKRLRRVMREYTDEICREALVAIGSELAVVKPVDRGRI